MKKNELKKVLKPLIKECIKEVIFEEGILSNLVKEVAQGLGQHAVITETKQRESVEEQDFSRLKNIELQQEAQINLEAKKRKLEESLGIPGVFTDTSPLPTAGKLGDSQSNSPLSNYAPNDPGVDITALMALAGGQNWKKMI